MILPRFLLLLYLQKTGHALQLIVPISHRVIMGEDVKISCSFTVNNPPIIQKFLAISWYFQGKEILSVQNAIVKSRDPRVSYTGRVEDGIADLSISNITIMDGGIYKCSILYTPKREEKEIRLELQAQPQINIKDKLVVKNKESSLSSVISGYYPVDIDIKWLRDGELLNNIVVGNPQRDLDGTYSVRSSITLTPSEEDRERIFSCRVQHESLTAPLQEDFKLVYGDIPSVNITFQAFKLDVEQNLVCGVSEFYPEFIIVNWYLNDTLVKNVKTRRINSSAVESVYPFTPTQQNRGMEVRCVVEHGTLTTPHVERLQVQVTDLTAQYKKQVVFFTVVLVLLLGAVTIATLMIKQRRKRLPKVRNITRSPGATFSLDVDHFYPETITVCWVVIQPPLSTQPRPIGSTILMQQNQDGTFNATSTCECLRGEIREDEPYIVRAVVEHNNLKHTKHREWKSDDKDNKDFLARPEVEMIQIPKLFVNQKIQLQCTVSKFYPDKLTVDWFMKINGKEKLQSINNDDRYKILNSKSELQPEKTFTHTAILEFTPSLEDQGSEIICKVDHSSVKEPIERTTQPLQVLVKPEIKQNIQLLINDSGDMVASFSLLSFYPKDLKMMWTYGQTQEINPSEETISENPDGTFSVTSQCTIPGNLFKNPQFRVRVKWDHPSLESSEYREISVQDPDFPWHPKIEETSALILKEKKETTVMCKISGYLLENLRVTWLEKRGETVNNTYEITDIKHERMANNSYWCSPSLSFTLPSVTEDLEFVCRVEHPSLEHSIEQSTIPRVNVTPQENKVIFAIYDSDQVVCSLSLMKFYPQAISIKWTHVEENTKTLPSSKKMIQTDDEKTFDATSECIVPWKYFKSLVKVTWEHESLTQPGFQDLRITDLPWRPRTHLSWSDANKYNIECNISAYFPDDLTVSWYKKNEGAADLVSVENDNKYKTELSEHQRQSDNTYSCTASLLIPTSGIDKGSVFICRVEHPSMKLYREERAKPIQKNSISCLFS
ncbi:uncharacterized protein LOC143923728 [Lithobates pipiens]